MRVLVIGNTHGQTQNLKQLLNKVNAKNGKFDLVFLLGFSLPEKEKDFKLFHQDVVKDKLFDGERISLLC